jgi:hypothetical protein
MELEAAQSDHFQCKRDTLAAADAQGYHAAAQVIAAHSVQEPRRQDCARRADRLAVPDRASLDIDDVLGQSELLIDGERYGRESLVDLDTLEINEAAPCPLARLSYGRYRSETE